MEQSKTNQDIIEEVFNEYKDNENYELLKSICLSINSIVEKNRVNPEDTEDVTKLKTANSNNFKLILGLVALESTMKGLV